MVVSKNERFVYEGNWKLFCKKSCRFARFGFSFSRFVFYIKSKFNLFDGTLTSRYTFVIKRFEKKSQLIVAGADVETTAEQVFTNDNFKEWPEWTKPLTKTLVGRELVAEISVKTEFKLELKGLTEEDVEIEDGVLRFKKALTVYVDSQAVGIPDIQKSGSGIVDKAVDAVTGGKKAQEFFAEKSQEAIYKTSEHVLEDKDRQKKVAKFASEGLEDLLNLGSEEELDVQLSVDDLYFVIEDKKE